MEEGVSYQYILFDRAGSVATITMNRPERLNALNVEMGVEILDALEASENDENVRVVVLTGAGRGFCAGDDMKGPTDANQAAAGLGRRHDDPAKHYVYGPGRWTTIVRTMMRMPQPTVGVINGHAHGAGFNLALGCDFRIMSETATLCVPFVKWAMATGTNRLQQFVGIGKALEWALLGTTLTATEAERWGLVTRLAPADQLAAVADEFIAKLADAPTASLGATKSAIYQGWERDPDTAYEYQGMAQHLVRHTDDYAEGRRAFLEKRAPRYNGRWQRE
jgi:2-(1,2-epoxy-1,2-dihydrophenyl)acetyl-CoA isomerase